MFSLSLVMEEIENSTCNNKDKVPSVKFDTVIMVFVGFLCGILSLFQNDVFYCLQGVRVERSGQFADTRVDSVDTKKRVIR